MQVIHSKSLKPKKDDLTMRLYVVVGPCALCQDVKLVEGCEAGRCPPPTVRIGAREGVPSLEISFSVFASDYLNFPTTQVVRSYPW